MNGKIVDFAYDGAPARTVDETGVPCGLTGSGLTLDRAVRNAVSMLSLDIPQAIRMASANPARVLGLEDRKGRLEVGFDADIVILDKDLRVTGTIVAGDVKYTA